MPKPQQPPGDEELEHVVQPEHDFSGKAEITLEGSAMTIVEHAGTSKEVKKSNVQ